ncbi:MULTISPECIES: M56 family metallopeptidase [Bacillus cereus group]|uniref:Cell surface protein n=2 Tax=Bacillus cereus group TaxID=86661 RepID=A0A9W5R8G1_BACCE|nr:MULTISPECIES: M56 family metallopeptidase [Bacillus cereus group]MEB4841814.1 M56 family metallopeptidase [Paenibacillus jamilae]EOQ16397.1 cell surface protein [Bacillus cereus VD184]MCR6851297.1 M56 family metallopeptidase [Bacillus thuringiensis]MDA2175985.1 M56 family metallopeptidase [Bacillus cereus]MDR4283350.1 M56 family metallopeptidase [Bacillus thuringiensis]
MKWQMRKIVLLAVIVSILFFSMLVYYVTYPFLFQNKMFLLSNFCLFQLEKHMKELSLIRIIIAGLLLLTVLIVCKRIWRQFFYSKKLQKVLIPFVRKRKQIYILPTTEVAAFTIGLFRPKVVMSEGLLQTFSNEEIDAIIFHEEYHQKNWDPLKLFCFTLLAEGMMYIPILKGLLQRYHTYQELAADKYAMQKMESSFELGSALLKLIKIKTMENRCVTASFAKTAINLRIEQVLNEKVVKLTIPLHTNSVYVTVGLFCMSVVLIVGECI